MNLFHFMKDKESCEIVFFSFFMKINSEAIFMACFRFPNSLVILKDGSIIFSESSTVRPRSMVILEAIESCPNGKLLHYDY